MEALRLAQQNLPPAALTLIRLGIWLMLLAAVFVPLERLFAWRPQKIFRQAILTDLGYFILSGLVPSLFMTLLLVPLAWGAHLAVPRSLAETVVHWPLPARASLLL